MIKIIKVVPLRRGTGLMLNFDPNASETNEFNQWVEQVNCTEYVYIGSIARDDYFEVNYDPALIIREGAPAAVLSMCLMKWQ